MFWGLFVLLGVRCHPELAQFRSQLLGDQRPSFIQVSDGGGERFFVMSDEVTPSDYLLEVVLQSAAAGVNYQREQHLRKKNFRLAWGSLSSFGETLQKRLEGRVFLDLGSGIPGVSIAAPFVAQQMGASAYVAVDLKSIPQDFYQSQTFWQSEKPFAQFYFHDDMLNFVKKLRRPKEGLVVHITGIEPKQLNMGFRVYREPFPEDRTYLLALLQALDQIMTPGELLILGPLSIGFRPELYDFRKRSERQTPQGFYQIWEKTR